MTIGEVRTFNVDGKRIRVEYVGENLYVVNDVLVCVDLNEGYDLFDPKTLLNLTNMRSDPYFPYRGGNEIIDISKGFDDGVRFIESRCTLGIFSDAVQKRVLASLRNYRRNNG
jgi:hypothetical protein